MEFDFQNYDPLLPPAYQKPNWNFIGDTLQDNFQLADIGAWGKNLMGATRQSLNNYGQGALSEYNKNFTDMPDANKYNTAFAGIQSLAGLYGGYKQMKMADKQYDMQKDMWNKSWDANRKSVNEAVGYRAANRFNGRPEEAANFKKEYSV